MIDESKIQANINSLITVNNKLLAQLKEKARSIQTKDFDLEVFIRDSVINNTKGVVPKVATVSADEAKKTIEEMRIINKKIQDNVIAIKQLTRKLSKTSLEGEALHNFKTSLMLYKRFIKSGTVMPYSSATDVTNTALPLADEINLDTVNITVKIEVPDATSTTMTLSQTTKDEVITKIRAAQSDGKRVMLEAYPWINNGTSSPSQWGPTDVATWFTNWTAILDEIIQIANDEKVGTIIIGANLDGLVTPTNEANWITMIQHVKSQFSGLVTYRQNWWYTDSADPATVTAYNDILNNGLFGELDFISITGYFELTNEANPTLETLISAWSNSTKDSRNQNIISEIEAFYNTWGKKIFLGEIGYVQYENTNTEPWNPNPSLNPSEVAQQVAYQALFEVFKSYDWFMGFSIHQISDSTNNYYQLGTTTKDTIANFDFGR